MRRPIIVFVWVIVGSLVSAQVGTTNTAKTSRTASKGEKSGLTSAAGVVTKFTPGQRIVLQLAPMPGIQPKSYVIGKSVRYVNGADKEINPNTIQLGSHVRIDFNAERVVVVD